MARIPIIAGNWKLHKRIADAAKLARAVIPVAEERPEVETVLCPPFTALAAVAEVVRGSRVRLAAQDVFWEETGAYTGEIGPGMLVDAGCRFVIIGHSERRGRFGGAVAPEALALFRESDAAVQLKVRAARAAGLTPILCCGETVEERRSARTDAVVAAQLRQALAGPDSGEAGPLVIAYEPVWAIGSDEVCGAAEANRVCGRIRAALAEILDPETAGRTRIQYGGSVKPENAAELLEQAEIDGALVGSASLNVEDFAAIVRAAAPVL